MTQVVSPEKTKSHLLEVDKDLLDALFVERSQGPISDQSVLEDLLQEYAVAQRKRIEDGLRTKKHLSASDVKATGGLLESMDKLEESAAEYAAQIMSTYGGGSGSGFFLTRELLIEELRKIVSKLEALNSDARKTKQDVGIDAQLLSELWQKYDENEDGSLESHEIENLLLDYVSGVKEKLEETHMGKRGHVVESSEYKRTVKIMSHLEQNCGIYSEKLAHMIDMDGDGIVVKEEFFLMFASGWASLLESAQENSGEAFASERSSRDEPQSPKSHSSYRT